MKQQQIISLTASFNGIACQNTEGVEYWRARDLMPLLDYDQWRRFADVIQRAQIACEKAGNPPENHFQPCGSNITLGSGAQRTVDDFNLTRYACYLIAQNGDPRKEAIAFAQTYFALQTRKQELIEERMQRQERLAACDKLTQEEKLLSHNLYERGVDHKGFGRIRSRGDAALFGGNSTQTMKEKLGVAPKRSLADFLPTVTLAAKSLATAITNHNVRENDLHGESRIGREHVQNNSSVRGMLAERGIKPENLPPAEDTKKVAAQRRL